MLRLPRAGWQTSAAAPPPIGAARTVPSYHSTGGNPPASQRGAARYPDMQSGARQQTQGQGGEWFHSPLQLPHLGSRNGMRSASFQHLQAGIAAEGVRCTPAPRESNAQLLSWRVPAAQRQPHARQRALQQPGIAVEPQLGKGEGGSQRCSQPAQGQQQGDHPSHGGIRGRAPQRPYGLPSGSMTGRVQHRLRASWCPACNGRENMGGGTRVAAHPRHPIPLRLRVRWGALAAGEVRYTWGLPCRLSTLRPASA